MKKVIIIGAGPAGLTAAYELLRKKGKYDVTILEATNDIGGISKTINYNGNRMDIGGHRFFSKDKRVNDFWKEILPLQGKPALDDKLLNVEKKFNKRGPDPEKTDKVMLIRNRVSRIFYLNKFFNYPIKLEKQTIINMGFTKTASCGLSYLKSIFIKKKEDSLENFYINRFGKKLYAIFFEGYTEKLWGRHPKKISADWGSQRVKGLSIIAIIKDMLKINKDKEISLIEEFYYPKYGPGQLWEEVSHKIEEKGGIIKKYCEVVNINCDNNKVTSVICKHGNDIVELKADIFISSMPLKDLVSGLDCKVPKNIKLIAKSLPYRDFVTIGLLVKKINLKNKTNIKTLNNIVPDCWIYVQDENIKLGRIQIFNNWSPYMVKNPSNTVWIGLEYFCNENDDFWLLSDKKRIDFVTNELVKMNIINKKDILDYHIEKVKKAYPAYFGSYKDIDKLIQYLNKFDNLYCVGRNGQHRYNNMDHSMMTSFEVVNNIEKNIKSKDNVWNVNTDNSYHELRKGEDSK